VVAAGEIDIRTGLLADELTPPQFVEERYGLVLPEGLDDFGKAGRGGRNAARDRRTGGFFRRTAASAHRLADRAEAEGRRTITGKAESDHFIAYRLGSRPGILEPDAADRSPIRSRAAAWGSRTPTTWRTGCTCCG
jgi:hypothetical protein